MHEIKSDDVIFVTVAGPRLKRLQALLIEQKMDGIKPSPRQLQDHSLQVQLCNVLALMREVKSRQGGYFCTGLE